MKTLLLTVGMVLAYAGAQTHAQTHASVVAEGAKAEIVADGFSFTEGPAVDGEGNIFFTDQPNDRIWKYSVDGLLSLFAQGMGRANGMYFDRQGRLLSCSDMNNEIWSIDHDGSSTVLVSGFDGKALNGPNDLWAHPDGGIYFTDPLYAREYWTRSREMQQEGQYLYYRSVDGKVSVVDRDYKQPNGIIGTPDGSKLYVADIGDGKTYAYDMQAGGGLSNRRLFTNMGSDGMTMDERGNIYLTGRGVTVFNPSGEQIEHIPVDARWTANVCFGGRDMRTLFITASEYLYVVRMNVRGVR